MPKISLSTWSLFLKMNYLECMQFAIKSGFQGIEIWSNPVDFWPRRITKKEINTIKSLARESRISLAIHICQGNNDLADINEGHLKETMKQLKETIRVCHEIGGELVVIHPGMMPYHPMHEENGLNPILTRTASKQRAVERLKKSLSEAASFAEKYKVVLGLENLSHVKGCIQSSFKDLADWVDEIGNPALQITLDTGHANLEGGVEKAIEVLGGRIKHMHLDDNNGQHSDHGELGSGTINWQALAPFLKGFDGMLSFEIKGLGDLEGAVLRSKTFVENLLKGN